MGDENYDTFWYSVANDSKSEENTIMVINGNAFFPGEIGLNYKQEMD